MSPTRNGASAFSSSTDRFTALGTCVLVVLDAGAHPERPLPPRTCRAHLVDHRGERGTRTCLRRDRRAARRPFVEDARGKLAAQGERHRPRDGRGAQGQQVGPPAFTNSRAFVRPTSPLFHHREALGDAEAMLLVDDHEAEPREGDPFREECVRPDDDGDLAGQDLRFGARAGRRPAPRDERDGRRRRARERSHGVHVLLGEEARWREDRDLMAGGDALRRRGERNGGLARPDVAEEQPPHGDVPGEILRDRLDGARLSCGQLERKLCEEPRPRRASRREDGRDRSPAHRLHPQPVPDPYERFGPRHPLDGSPAGRVGWRHGEHPRHTVQRPKQRDAIAEILSQGDCRGDGVRQGGKPVERCANRLSQRSLRHADPGIASPHGSRAFDVREDIGVRHLRASSVVHAHAADDQTCSALRGRSEHAVRREEPRRVEDVRPVRIAKDDAYGTPASHGNQGRALHDRANDDALGGCAGGSRPGRARDRLLDRQRRTQIVPRHGERPHEVGDRGEPAAPEDLSRGLSEARERVDGLPCRKDDRRRAPSRPLGHEEAAGAQKALHASTLAREGSAFAERISRACPSPVGAPRARAPKHAEPRRTAPRGPRRWASRANAWLRVQCARTDAGPSCSRTPSLQALATRRRPRAPRRSARRPASEPSPRRPLLARAASARAGS